MIFRAALLGVSLLGGVTTSQVPEFAQQYRQRMGGAIDALTKVMDDFRADAARHGLGVEAALTRMAGSPDPLVEDRAVRLAQTRARLEALTRQREALLQAGPFARLGVFARDVDPELARATWSDFEPAVPVTSEGAVSAGAGFLAVLFAGGLIGGVRRIMRRKAVT